MSAIDIFDKAVRELYRGDGGRLSSYDEGWNDGVEAAIKIRYPVVPTSVTEEWTWKVATGDGLFRAEDVHETVLATLAALNIEVTK
jgi:hypothetical protein